MGDRSIPTPGKNEINFGIQKVCNQTNCSNTTPHNKMDNMGDRSTPIPEKNERNFGIQKVCNQTNCSDTTPHNKILDPLLLKSHVDLMKSYLNLSVEPCDDFYEYACGNYRSNSELQYPLSRNTQDVITKHLVGRAKQLLYNMDLAQSLNVSRELEVAQRFYNACLGADLYPFPAADPNYLRLIRSIGGFPAVDGTTWNASNFSWFHMSAHLTNYGAEGLISKYKKYFVPFDLDIFQDQLNKQRMQGYLRSFKLSEEKIAEVIDGMLAFWREASNIRHRDCYPFGTNYFEFVWIRDNPAHDCSSTFLQVEQVFARHREAVANYLAMKLLYSLDAKLNGSEYQGDYCATMLQTSMSILFNKLDIAEHFSEEITLEISEIEKELQKSVRRSLEEADWLDSESQKELLTNSQMKFPFNVTKFNILTDRITREIGLLEIVNDSYAATNINLHRLSAETKRFTTQEIELRKAPTTYTMLLPPVYHQSWPFSLKFGALGFLITTESIYYPQFSGENELSKRVHCFEEYHHKYVDSSDDSNLYIDFGRLRLTFAAYQSHMKHLLEDLKQEKINEQMPGLDLTPNQLFFLGSTQMFCNTPNSKLLILSALMSSEDFFQAFNCPVGSRMRPTAKTCRLW